MNKVEIKPLSVNQAWQGKRYKTIMYSNYAQDLMWILPKVKVPEGNLEIHLEFGFSNKASDWDNPIKPFVDVLQKKYNFDDKRIYKAVVEKKIVKKGEEYIKFAFKSHE